MQTKYLIIGKRGQLGKEFVNKLKYENFTALDSKELNITNLNEVLRIIGEIKPQIIINCSAYNLVDNAEENNFSSFNVNSIGTYNLAYASKKFNSFLVHYSSDYVFEGRNKNNQILYEEDDETKPLNEYGKSKLLGERLLQETTDKYLIFRLSWVYGSGKQNFIFKLKTWAKNNLELKIAEDEFSIPTSTKTITNITLSALEKKLTGTYHLTNSGFCSRSDLAKLILDELKLTNKIIPVKTKIFNLPAKRPNFSAMSNEKISKELNIEIEGWENEVIRYLKR